MTGSGWASNTAVYFSLCSESSSCSRGLAVANASGNFASPAHARFFREQAGWSTTTGALLVRLVDTPLPAAYTLIARDFRSDTDTTVPVTVQPGAVAVGTASRSVAHSARTLSDP